jgi:hypothetical protein
VTESPINDATFHQVKSNCLAWDGSQITSLLERTLARARNLFDQSHHASKAGLVARQKLHPTR